MSTRKSIFANAMSAPSMFAPSTFALAAPCRPKPVAAAQLGSTEATGTTRLRAIKLRLAAALCATTLFALAGLSGSGHAGELAVAALPDGRLQLFVVSQGQLLTAWKQTRNSGSPWTPLAAFDPPPSGSVKDVAVGRLPDGRLQMFVTGSDGLTTTWKRTPYPDSGWTAWGPFETVPAETPAVPPNPAASDDSI
jgi:hypothetical protein